MLIELKGIEFEVEFELDKDIESGELLLEVTAISISGVEVGDIISEEWYELIWDEVYKKVKYERVNPYV